MNQNVTNLSGVPSWMMAVLKHILEVKGTDNLAEVWPDLEVFFMEGLLLLLIANNINSLFVATRCIIWKHTMPVKVFRITNDFSDPSMLLMIDYGVFYEFIPMEDVGTEILILFR